MPKIFSFVLLIFFFLFPFLLYLPLNITFNNLGHYFFWIIIPLLLTGALFFKKSVLSRDKVIIFLLFFFLTANLINLSVSQFQLTNSKIFSFTNFVLVESFFNLISLVEVFYLGTLIKEKTDHFWKKILLCLSFSTLLLGLLYSISLGVTPFLAAGFVKANLISFLAMQIFINLSLLAMLVFSHSLKERLFFSFSLFINLLLTIYLIYQASLLATFYLPLNLSFGLPIALKTLNNYPWEGFGINNFIEAFRQYKPLNFNLESYWSWEFVHSSNEILELLTTQGAIGLASFLFLILFSLRFRRAKLLSYQTVILFIISFLTPLPLMLRVLLFFILGMLSVKITLPEKKKTSLFFIASGTLFSITSIFLVSLLLVSNIFYQQSLKEKDPQKKYQLEKQAIKYFPLDDSYHRLLSQTSLTFTDLLLAPEGNDQASPSVSLTKEEQKLLEQLINQSISEGKTALLINPTTPNLANLSLVYKNLIGFTPQAQELSLSFMALAIQKDPFNPRWQTEIANIYFIAKDFNQAEIFFTNALKLKADYVFALYGLGVVKKEQGEKEKARKYFEKAIELTPLGSSDFVKIQEEIASLDK